MPLPAGPGATGGATYGAKTGVGAVVAVVRVWGGTDEDLDCWAGAAVDSFESEALRRDAISTVKVVGA